jgi:hypothetical protein
MTMAMPDRTSIAAPLNGGGGRRPAREDCPRQLLRHDEYLHHVRVV